MAMFSSSVNAVFAKIRPAANRTFWDRLSMGQQRIDFYILAGGQRTGDPEVQRCRVGFAYGV